MVSFLELKTKYLFGKNAIFQLPSLLENHIYKKALILYGYGSVKKNGSYNDTISVLNKLNLKYFEFDKIEPNPRNTTIDRCVEFCRDKKIDVIFALGGGSVIDSAKTIATLVTNTHYKSCWDLASDSSKIRIRPIDVISIITLAGSGSENNNGSVITNFELKQKRFLETNCTPIISVQDPQYTFTVSPYMTACGIFDCFSHLLEQYFGKRTFDWTSEFIFANLKTLINFSILAINKPNDFDARSNIFWTTSMSLNGLASFNSSPDWSVHTIEHAFSGLWDIPHGAGLALITPVYLMIRSKREKWFRDKVISLGKNVFKTDTFEKTIDFLKKFIKAIGLFLKWSDFDQITSFSNEHANFLKDHCTKFGEFEDTNLYFETINELKEMK